MSQQRLKDFLRQVFPRRRAPDEQPKDTMEQMRDVIDLAVEFDKLQGLPVWAKVLERMGAEVNGELVEATKFKYEPVKQTTHTIRWDAKRELLDNTLGWIESTQRERDRIVNEFKEYRYGGNDGTRI